MTQRPDIMHHDRLSSGIAGLDLILRGGFLRSGVYIVQGSPGTGKTIFANQLCFHHVSNGGRALYVTLLSESHARMLLHLKDMSFFAPQHVSESLYYISAFKALEDEGLKALLDVLRREMRGHRASVLVLDGLVAAEESASSAREFKKFIHEMQVQAHLVNCTIFLLTNGGGDPTHPEHTMVDGLIELRYSPEAPCQDRELLIRKFRGSSSLLGCHAFAISDDGIQVYPRLEALLDRPAIHEPSRGRLSLGSRSLDEMLGGGVAVGSTSLIIGPSGVGKTTLGLQFLASVGADEQGLFFGFYESPEHILQRSTALGLGLEALAGTGQLELLWQPPTDSVLDALGARIIEAVERRRVTRVMVDGLGALSHARPPERTTKAFAALANELRSRGITSMYTVDSQHLRGVDVEPSSRGASPIADNILLLKYADDHARIRRVFGVLKMRDGAYDPYLRSFSIGAGGLVLDPKLKPRKSSGLMRRS